MQRKPLKRTGAKASGPSRKKTTNKKVVRRPIKGAQDKPAKGVEGALKSLYFASAIKKGVQFIPSGCTPLDCTMGGGYPLHRVTNIIGDRSSGKTLQAMEAVVNFLITYPEGEPHYIEAESAFDKDYAEALGIPVSKIHFHEDIQSVEAMAGLIEALADRGAEDKVERLVIVDSLDSLSSEAEIKRDFGEATYGQEKAKMMSEMFRKLVRKIKAGYVTLIIISQIRDKIGAVFGKKWTRSGGKALDFYASLVMVLAEVKKRKKTIGGVARVVGVDIRARNDKNKVGLPFRECQYPIVFGYGMEDAEACVAYLESIKAKDALEDIGVPSKFTAVHINKLLEDPERMKLARKYVIELYETTESKFLPTRSKY